MKKLSIPLLILCLMVTSSAYSQTCSRADSIKILQDSIHSLEKKIKRVKYRERRAKAVPDTLSAIQIRANRIIGSLFGESSQLSNADSLINDFDNMPSFGMHKDNYFITGTEMSTGANRTNSDAKFQVSIRQRLTNSVLPFNTHIFLTYTQKAFWDIYKESFPFRDLNFNPSIGIGRPLIHNNRLLGTLSFEFEHESNGKDGDASRSWNKISFGALFTFSDRWIFQTKLWVPLIDGDNNADLTNYSGYGYSALSYSSLKRKYNASCVIVKRAGNIFDANIILNFAVRIFSNEDLYLFAEHYNGYGECMLNYKEYRQRIRVGLMFKSNFISFY